MLPAFMRRVLPAASLCAALWHCSAAQPAETPDLDAGRELARELQKTSDPAVVFSRVGPDRVQPLLLAVGQHGMQPTASAQDWADMHAAYSGLIEFETARHNYFKAAVWAQLQAALYRSLDEDSAQALTFSKKSLELQQQSGFLTTVYTRHLDVATDQMALGEYAAAEAELRQAQRLNPDPHSSIAAQIERRIVQAELRQGQLTLAVSEAESFAMDGAAVGGLFGAEALLARADVLLDEAKYTDAVDAMKTAWKLGGADKAFGWEMSNVVLRCVLDSIRSIGYDDALGLAKVMGQAFPNLPISVVGIARESIQSRRRMAGDLDALLREHFNDLEDARRSGSAAAQAEVLCSLAVTYQAMNDHDDRITVLKQAVALAHLERSNASQEAGALRQGLLALRMLGDAYADADQPELAQSRYAAVVSTVEGLQAAAAQLALKDLYADAVLGEARVDTMLGQFEAGRDSLARAERGGLQLGKFDRMFLKLEQARLEKAAGNRPEALSSYQQAADAAVSEREKLWEVAIRLEMAQFAALAPASAGDIDKQLSQIQTRATALGFDEAQWHEYFISGLLAESTGNATLAIERYRKAVDELDRVRANVSETEARATITGTRSVDDLYARLIALLTDAGRKEDAWEYVERHKARSFLELLHGRTAQPNSPDPHTAELHALEKQILDLQWQTSPQNAKLTRSAGEDIRSEQRRLHDLEVKFTVLRQEAALRNSRSGQALSLRPLTLAEVQSRLPSDTALVEYAFTAERAIAFVITHERAVEGAWKIDPQQLRAEVQRVRGALSQTASASELDSLLPSVSNLVLRPLLPAIPGEVSRLIVVPTDCLTYLPFQVLPVGPQQSAIDRFAISYLPNATSLAFLGHSPPVQAASFLGAIGDISVDGMPPLPGTIAEVQAISRSDSGAQVAAGPQFTYARVREALLDQPAVHLATHGVLNAGSPLLNAILTAPEAGSPSRLSLYELTDWNIRARLVVLSACQTALGKLSSGDEVTGLSRMFLQAGADTVVASLWSVNDASTAMLMRNFYAGLKRGNSPAQALRLAALEVRRQYPSPYYWAPFVVNGAD